ncbi:transcription elongation factor GreA [Salinisphaera shabanensis T35B1]|jgi:transcription elongation factor GreA|uniref:Transcription elongation factor GreA n=1 Tax=Salinisphaera shabanensis E1L3A TaxID=1033802 RepID=U2E479_9GAMM|nr:transcription elongation factor GreA [Salinisphaera shabanensis]ERJ18651.1 Transcription elongation factor GreA protein [Salinisphaera shabanensis E1L3A]
MDKTPLTQNGADALRDELKRLKKTERPRIVAAIEEARAHGDLKENAEYHAAKEEQGFNEGRINDIESKLATAQIIDVARVGAQANGRVVFGATLDLADEDSGEEFTYQIVGEDEADIKKGLLSFASPIARALIGKTEGDVVDIDVPGGRRTLEIVEVRYI